MRLFFARLNNEEQLGRQFENGFYQAQRGSSYFAELNEIDFAVENVYVFAFCGGKIELWKPSVWADDGSQLHFTKTGVNIALEALRFASFRYFFINLDLIIFPIRRPKKKAFFEIGYDDAFTETMLLDSATYRNAANFRKIEVFDTEASSQAADPLSLVLYKKENQWQFKAPQRFENELVQYFRDNTKFKEGSQPQKNKVLKLVDNAKTYPQSYGPEQLPIIRLYDAFFCDYKDDTDAVEEELDIVKEEAYKELSSDAPENPNLILYGPPGTGKTFNSINHALEIVWGKELYTRRASEWSREQLTEAFRQLLIDLNEADSDGQIGFVTFHQSMNYEDFVEGIKPVDPKESSKPFLEYKVVPGIFKHIATKAKKAPFRYIDEESKALISGDDTFKKAHFVKVDLRSKTDETGKDSLAYCLDQNCISVFNAIQQNLQEYDKTGKPELNAFVDKPAQETYVIVTTDDKNVSAIGRITGAYEYNGTEVFRHKRPVTWLLQGVSIPAETVYATDHTEGVFCPLTPKKVMKDFFVKGGSALHKKKAIPKNYVLIIDEINRGNIAQIFGELITLIEKDKRTGCPEEITVTLPYSKESFSVPKNLYIIGTMNTADRSVEALDTALRRRFMFKEMMPQPWIIQKAFEQEYLGLCVKHDPLKWEDEEWVKIEEPFNDAILKSDTANRFEDFKQKVNALKKPREFKVYYDCWEQAKVKLVTVDKLEIINSRIEILLNRDHLIGHSYFIGKYTREAIYQTFYQNIIPLLKEYFYGDYGKIGLVLGKEFVRMEDQENSELFADFEYPDVQDFDSKTIYRIHEFKNSNGEIDFDAFYQAFCTI